MPTSEQEYRLQPRLPVSGYSEWGLSSLESVFVMLMALGTLALGIKLIIDHPVLLEKALPIAAFGALTGLFAWAGRQAITTVNRRSKVLILELLSDGKPHTRREIRKALRWRAPGSLYLDALADLVSEGRVVVADGKYTVQATDSNKKVILSLE